MDYLIFAIGLFLAASGIACLLFRRTMPAVASWKAGAIAFFALAAYGWLDLLGFAMDADPVMEILMAGVFAVSSGVMAKFTLRGLGASLKFRIFLAVVAAVVAGWFALFPPLHAAVPSLGAMFGAGFGWVLGKLLLPEELPKRPWVKWLPMLALALLVGTLFWPGLLETVQDTGGYGFAPSRLALLGMLMVAVVAAGGTAAYLWYRLEVAGHKDSPVAAAKLAVGKGRRFGAGFVGVVLLGGILTEWVGTNDQEARAGHLLDSVKIGASSLDGDVLATMAGDAQDLQDVEYSVVQRRLRDLRASLPGCRFVYTVGLRGKDFVYLVDSEALNSPSYLPPGEVIPGDPAKWVNVRAGNSYFGGPGRDVRGASYTALLPVWDSSRNSSSIIGVDYPVREWLRPLVARRLTVMWGVLAAASLLLGYAVHRQLAHENDVRILSMSERLSHAMESADFDGIDWYPERNQILLGDRLAEKLGLTNKSNVISPRSFWKRIHPEDRPILAFRLRQSESTMEQAEGTEIRLLDGRFNPMWVIFQGRLASGSGDGPSHVAGTVLNVHESKRMRLELERQRQFARQVMEAVPGGVVVIDASGVIKLVNRAYTRMAMMAEAFLVGSAYQRTLQIGPEVAADKARFEAKLKRGDGSLLPVKVLRSPFTDSAQEMGTIFAVIDLSAIRESEHALLRCRAEVRKLSIIARMMDDAVILTNPDGRIGWVNEGFTRLTGYSREEVTGRKPGSFLQAPDVDTEVCRFMHDRIKAGEGFEAEVTNHTKQGVVYLAHIDCQPVKDDDGVLIGFLAIHRNATAERKLESALAEPMATETEAPCGRLNPDGDGLPNSGAD